MSKFLLIAIICAHLHIILQAMDNSTIIWATIIIAVIALVGRIIINHQKKGTINWFKLLLLGVAILACLLGYMNVDPQRVIDTWKGEATMAESRTSNIAGRVAGEDIPCYAKAVADNEGLYCVPVVDSLSRTEYYLIKDVQILGESAEREVEESIDNRQKISHKTTVFEVTKNPKGNADKYLPLYKLSLHSGGAILAAIDERDAKDEAHLPVARIVESSNRIASLAEKLDTSMISEEYLVCSNTQDYVRNQTTYIIYRAIAGVLFAILAVLVLILVKHLAKR